MGPYSLVLRFGFGVLDFGLGNPYVYLSQTVNHFCTNVVGATISSLFGKALHTHKVYVIDCQEETSKSKCAEV
jgi:hypothetical protein